MNPDHIIKIQEVDCINSSLAVNHEKLSCKEVACGTDKIENNDSSLVSKIKQQLEEKHNKEMSELREYFQNKCSDLERQYKEEVFNQRSCMISDAEDEPCENVYKNSIHGKRPRSADARLGGSSYTIDDGIFRTTNSSCKNNNKRLFAKQLHNITKMYEDKLKYQKENLEKDRMDEINKLKKELENEYSSKINKLQNDLNTLSDERKFEQAVRNLHKEVKEEYNKELNNVKKNLYNDYCNEFKKEIEQNVATLNSEHCMKIHQLKLEYEEMIHEKSVYIKQLEDRLSDYETKFKSVNNEWTDKLEQILSNVITESAMKTVLSESNFEAELMKRNELLSLMANQLKENAVKHEEEINSLKLNYEFKIKALVADYNNTEHSSVIGACSYEQQSLHISAENLNKYDLFSEINSTRELEIADKITDEINKMRDCYQKEVSLLKRRNNSLQNALTDLKRTSQQELESANELFMSKLIAGIQELLSKEGEEQFNSACPAEIATVEKLFYSRYQQNLNKVIEEYESKLNELKLNAELSQLVNTTSNEIGNHVFDEQHTQTELVDIEKLILERDKLRQLNYKLQNIIKYFTEYLLKCEDELNQSFIGELLKCRKFISSEASEKSSSKDSAFNNSINRVSLVPDMSEVLRELDTEENYLDESTYANDTSRDLSAVQLELNACLEKVKDQAAALLCLTSSRLRKDVVSNLESLKNQSVQADLLSDVKDEFLARLMCEEENSIKLHNEIALLKKENNELKEKIISLESVEGYGESLDSPLLSVDNKFQVFFTGQGYKSAPVVDNSFPESCHECEKTKEEAKHIVDDLKFQLKAADKKLRNLNKFHEDQIAEWELERDKFDKKIRTLEEELKEKDKKVGDLKEKAKEMESDIAVKNNEINMLTSKLEHLSINSEDYESKKQNLEEEISASKNKIVSLRDRIDELEKELADKSQLADQLEQRLKEKQTEYETQYQDLISELDSLKEGDVEQLQTLREQHQMSFYMLRQVKKQLTEIESAIVKRTKELIVNCLSSFAENTVLTSPSEDISTSEPLEECSVASPNSTDTLPVIVSDVPKNCLPCLCLKLEKLYSAEDALLKHARDLNLCITKQSDQLEEIQLERDTLQEKLKEITSKFTEVKVKLENYQHKEMKVDSENVFKLNNTILELKSCLESASCALSQKEAKMTEMKSKISNLEKYIKTSEFEFFQKMNEDRKSLDQLQVALNELTKEKQKLVAMISSYRNVSDDNLSLPSLFTMLIDDKNADIEHLKQTITMLQSQFFDPKSNQNDYKEDKMCLADNIVVTTFASDESDNFRCEANAISSDLIRTNVAEPNTDDKIDTKPVHLVSKNTPNVSETCSLLDIIPGISMSSVEVGNESCDVGSNSARLKEIERRLESETNLVKLNHQLTEEKSKLEELVKEFEIELSKLKTENAELNRKLQDYDILQRKLHDVETSKDKILKKRKRHWEKMKNDQNSLKERNEQLLIELESEKKKINGLHETELQLEAMKGFHSTLEQNLKELQLEKQNLENRFSSVNEEYEREKKSCKEWSEESSRILSAMKEKISERERKIVELEEKIKLSENEKKENEAILSNIKKRCLILAEKSEEDLKNFVEMKKNFHSGLERINELEEQLNEMQHTKGNIDRLLEEKSEQLQMAFEDLRLAEKQINQLENEVLNLRSIERDGLLYDQQQSLPVKKEFLEDLTKKIQLEVDKAVELDENMLNNLDIVKNCDDLLLASTCSASLIPDDVKSSLLKILRYGFDALSGEEKDTLQFTLFSHIMERKSDELDDKIKYLENHKNSLEEKFESERSRNEKLLSKNLENDSEINRLNMIVCYYENRNDFLLSKMEEYQKKATEAEINCTKENTRFIQSQMTLEAEKKRSMNKQREDAEQKEKLEKRISNLTNQNITLQEELRTLQSKIQILTAELNSMKIMGKYNSDTESELTEFINPLKKKLESIEKHNSSITLQYEKEKNKAEQLKVQVESLSDENKRLSTQLDSAISEKLNSESKIIDLKLEIDKLSKVNDKLVNNLALAELNEKRIRKQIKAETEAKENKMRNLELECSELQQKFHKLNSEYNSLKEKCSIHEARVKTIICRMLKAESFRRNLVWQKQFLLRSLQICIRSKISPKQKFKSIGLCIVLIIRARTLVVRRQNHHALILKSHLSQKYNPYASSISCC